MITCCREQSQLTRTTRRQCIRRKEIHLPSYIKHLTIDDKQYNSLYEDCEELVKVLVHRCKKLNYDGHGSKEENI